MGEDQRDEEGGQPAFHEVDGNRLRLLTGGPERLDALVELIESAQRRVDIYVYIFDNDASGAQVVAALREACARGVAVTLLIDAFGSAFTPDALFAPLVEAGARFGRFGRKRSTRYLIRNHQKMIIADGIRALVGGFNIADSYFAAADDPAGWRDMALLVEGPLAAELQLWFARIAAWTLGKKQSFLRLGRMVRDWRPGVAQAAWLMGGPTPRLNGWARHVKHDLQAGRSVDLVSAYFSPGWGVARRLEKIGKRGPARLVTPTRSDNYATIGAARHLYPRLIRAGFSIFELLPQKLHTKLLVIDDVAYVGSANFDMRSLFLNVELMLRVEDAGFAAAVREQVDAHVVDSRRIDEATYRAMAGPLSRLRWWLDYLLVGVLDYTVTRRLNFRRRPQD